MTQHMSNHRWVKSEVPFVRKQKKSQRLRMIQILFCFSNLPVALPQDRALKLIFKDTYKFSRALDWQLIGSQNRFPIHDRHILAFIEPTIVHLVHPVTNSRIAEKIFL